MGFFTLLVVMSVSFSAFSQPMPDEIHTFVEENAEFPGGIDSLMKFVQKNLQYPELQGYEIQGKVFLRFIVEKDGAITNISVLKGVSGCPECDKEAVRVVKLMPKWTPAKNAGMVVRSYFDLPVTFRIM